MRTKSVVMWAALVSSSLLWACSGSDQGSSEPAAEANPGGAAENSVLQDSWMYTVVADPAALGPFEKGQSGDGWLAFFNNDLEGARRSFGSSCTPSDAPLDARAAAGFPCVGLARTHLEQANFFAEAAEVGRVTLRQFYLHRETHPEEVLPSLHQPYFQGVNLLQSGDKEGGLALLTSYSSQPGADPLLAALAQRIVAGVAGSDPLIVRLWGSGDVAQVSGDFAQLPVSTAAAAYRARLDFMAAVARSSVAEATALIRPIPSFEADLKEELPQAEGTSKVAPTLFHFDSSFLTAMSRLHALTALEAIAGASELAVLRVEAERLLGKESSSPASVPGLPAGLALVLFSTTPRPGDLPAAQPAEQQTAPLLSRLASSYPALGSEPTTSLADLDPFIDGSNKARTDLADMLKAAVAHGANMDADMGLSERFRGALLLERARQFQGRFSVRLETELAADAASAGIAARSLLELVLDKNPSPPNGQLKRARISFRNDPTLLVALARAQLDTRQSYEANDYIRPLSQLYAELVPVREALAALDSAWNPARRGSVR